MIRESTKDTPTGRKVFHLQCEKTGKRFKRVEREEFQFQLSNTEVALCDEAIEQFKAWMKNKGYLKTDCWCKHIQEFINASI